MTKFIKKHKIPYNFKKQKEPKPTMFDTIAESPNINFSSKEVKKLNEMKKKSDKLYAKAFKCYNFGLVFYILFFCFLVLYLVSIILIGIGVSKTAEFPVEVYYTAQDICLDVNNVADATL